MRSSLRFGGDCRHILIGGESQPVSALLPADGTGEVIADNDVGVGLPAEAFTNPAEVTATDRTGTIVMCAHRSPRCSSPGSRSPRCSRSRPQFVANIRGS